MDLIARTASYCKTLPPCYMDQYSNRRAKKETGFLRRDPRISSGNQNPEDRTYRNSDGPSSSMRPNTMKTWMVDNQERPRYSRDPFKSSNSKVMPASSSRFPLEKFEEKRRQSLSVGINTPESSSRRKAEFKRPECSKNIVGEDDIADALQTKPEDSSTEESQLLAPDPLVALSASSSDISSETDESLIRNASRSSRTHTLKHKELNVFAPGACSSSSTDWRRITGNSSVCVKPSYDHVGGLHKHGLNPACTLSPNVRPSGCPYDSVNSRRLEAMRKRASVGECSSSSKSLSGPSGLAHSPPTYLRDTGHRIRMRQQSLSQQMIQSSSRNHQDHQDLAVSLRTIRSSPQGTRLGVSEERLHSMLSAQDSSTRIQQSDQSRFSLAEISPTSSRRPFSVELPHQIYSSSRCGSNTWSARRRSRLFEQSPPPMFHGPMGERDSQRQITTDGVIEVSVALEMIEQGAELTYEQLLVLETNLLLGAFDTIDQHRGMRMDIDNMSYEELLALEERMGSVSTALSEEQLMKCLRRSVYCPVAAEASKSHVDDLKCSICQEEYTQGEEVGRMPCEHQYHVCCIGQWLRLKNWCPVCKASAVPSVD